ncbi:MAG: MarR family transcriptional regulator [Sphingobium sp.]|nr:MarR family transcriptional regulator [Sphingobium sp.]
MLNVSPPTAAPPHSDSAREAPTAAQVRRYLAARRKRDQHASGLFADPAWDMLLHLFAASLEGTQVTVREASLVATCPPKTSLRYLGLMAEAGLIGQKDHHHESRAKIIEITSEGQDLVLTFLTHMLD